MASRPVTRHRGFWSAGRSTDAVLLLAQVGAFELYDYIDFSEWFTTSLGAEAMELCPAAKPLRRRAILMLGCWVSKLGDHRSATYGILQTALSDSDTVIRLAAVDTLRSLIDDWDFQEVRRRVGAPTGILTRGGASLRVS